jgi:uncharacterized RDD family membrane protein YckC
MNNYSNNSYNSFTEHTSPHRISPAPQSGLATPQTRIVAFILDAILMGLLLGIGWFIWFVMIAGRGTTPGHDLMGHVIIDRKTGQPASFGRMLIRECFLKGILSMFLASLTMFINYIIDGAFIFREDRRAIHDYLIGTEVIQERSSALFEKLQSL